MLRFICIARTLACVAAAAIAVPSPAYIFWGKPVEKGAPVKGDEPGIALPMPGARPTELRAGLLWSLRAGLNVAALQCQFEPGLRTVDNYNQILRQHGVELREAYDTIGAYFKRTLSAGSAAGSAKGKAAKGKVAKASVSERTWRLASEAYNTKTYNSFSTMHAQFSFCDTAASIGRDALALPPGELGSLASLRMREFRNSLIPIGDPGLTGGRSPLAFDQMSPLVCFNKNGKVVRCKRPRR